MPQGYENVESCVVAPVIFPARNEDFLCLVESLKKIAEYVAEVENTATMRHTLLDKETVKRKASTLEMKPLRTCNLR